MVRFSCRRVRGFFLSCPGRIGGGSSSGYARGGFVHHGRAWACVSPHQRRSHICLPKTLQGSPWPSYGQGRAIRGVGLSALHAPPRYCSVFPPAPLHPISGGVSNSGRRVAIKGTCQLRLGGVCSRVGQSWFRFDMQPLLWHCRLHFCESLSQRVDILPRLKSFFLPSSW